MIIYQKKKVGVKKMTKDVRKRFTFRIPHDMYEQLKHKAKKKRCINKFIDINDIR